MYPSTRDFDNAATPFIVVTFVALGVVALFYEQLDRRLKPIAVGLPLIFLAATVCRDLFLSNVVPALIIGAGVIVGIVLTVHQNKPLVRDKIRPWLKPVPFVALGVLIILELLPNRVAQEQQKPDTAPTGAIQTRTKEQAPPIVSDNATKQQKLRDLIASEEFKQDIKKAAKAGAPPKFLRSLSNFQEYMESKGVTDDTEIDLSTSKMKNAFEALFERHHPDKTPLEVDAEMATLFLNNVNELGYNNGKDKFMRTPKVIAWSMVRFEMWNTEFGIPKPGQESITTWMEIVHTDGVPPSKPEYDLPIDTIVEQATAPKMPPASADEPPIASQPEKVNSGQQHESPPVTQTQPDAPVPIQSTSTLVQPPPELPAGTDITMKLKEEFSAERFERAMSTLERYGPEEGLRRLKENDPEFARQMEQQHNRPDQPQESDR